MNKVLLIGNLGKDIELKNAGETSLVRFGLGVPEYSKGENKTHWINCKAFGKTAELMAKYCGKGDKVAVTARLSTNTWEDKETGKKNYSTEIIIESLDFLTSKKEKAESEDIVDDSDELLPF